MRCWRYWRTYSPGISTARGEKAPDLNHINCSMWPLNDADLTGALTQNVLVKGHIAPNDQGPLQ